MSLKNKLKLVKSSFGMTKNPKSDSIAKLIKEYFDEAFYLENYPECDKNGSTPLQHYINHGWKLLYDPSAAFSTKYYLDKYDDVKKVGINPLYHYVKYGIQENRIPHPFSNQEIYADLDPKTKCIYKTIEEEFDFKYYADQYLASESSKADCILHYIQTGSSLNYNPSAEFSTCFYLKHNEDVAEIGMNPFFHFIKHGRNENRASATVLIAEMDAIEDDYEREVFSVLEKEFDYKFYKEKSKIEFSSRIEAILHYMRKGVDLKLDPNANFSTRHYLEANFDLSASDINPFYHFLKFGRHEGRSSVDILHESNLINYRPSITAIIPNYNHERYLEERIESILNQSYENIEILILDDCSTDNSRQLIKRYANRYSNKVKFIFNEVNSGGVFNQWEKGLKHATGDLIWICESDDSVTPNFIENLYRYFIDPAVMIAFGRIQFMDSEGAFMEGLDGYREGAWKGVWGNTIIKPAKSWFDGPFGIRNVIPNVGGCIFRKQNISQDDWKDAKRYKVLGDWHLYSILASGGKIVYEPTAVSYFRQHVNNTSVKSFVTDSYYVEHYWLIEHLICRWGISKDIVDKFVTYVQWQYLHHFGQDKKSDFYKIFDRNRLNKLEKNKNHIAIGFLGFHIGGGEIFPINLANALLEQGYIVSMLAIDLTNSVKEIYELLDSRVAVYSTDDLNKIGLKNFISKTGIEIFNTHNIGLEFNLLLKNDDVFNAKYIVTLHGSYEVTPFSQEQLQTLANKVDHWIYTADKNLKPLESANIASEKFTKTKNGMKIGSLPFDVNRQDLGIRDDSFVFGFMARGIASKGWEQVIRAFKMLDDDNAHLILVGTGDEQLRTEAIYGDEQNVHFLGFKSNVYGFFKMCDCCVLPTRFKGESYPLVLIQSMQVGVPIVSVKIGEINNMLNQLNTSGGICIDYTDDDSEFENAFSAAMRKMKTDNQLLRKFQRGASEIGKLYSISKVAKLYNTTYQNLLKH